MSVYGFPCTAIWIRGGNIDHRVSKKRVTKKSIMLRKPPPPSTSIFDKNEGLLSG